MTRADMGYLTVCTFLATCNAFSAISEFHMHKDVEKDLQTLTEMNAQVAREIQKIEADLESLKNPAKVEHILRDELGYGRAKDVTLVF